MMPLPVSGSLSRGVFVHRALCPWSSLSRGFMSMGVSVGKGKVGSTYPTGMISCLL